MVRHRNNPLPFVLVERKGSPIISEGEAEGVMELPHDPNEGVYADRSGLLGVLRELNKAGPFHCPTKARSRSEAMKRKGGADGKSDRLSPGEKRLAPWRLARRAASGGVGQISNLGDAIHDADDREFSLARSDNWDDMSAGARVKETIRLFRAMAINHAMREDQRRKSTRVDKKLKRAQRLKKQMVVDKLPNGHAMKAYKERAQVNEKMKKQMVDDKLPNRHAMGAYKEMREHNLILYPRRKIGHLEGIDVGHQFRSRLEMVILGFHNVMVAGIDYISSDEYDQDGKKNDFPIAVSVIMSGRYEDDVDDMEEVVYSGQGGNSGTEDQELVRGNLALKNNFEKKMPVRFSRGHVSKHGKVYTYDGLYEVVNCSDDKSKSGHLVYKFDLKRLRDQPLLSTKQVHFLGAQVPRSFKDVRGLVCDDISGGMECLPIPATNVVDTPPVPPRGYTYINTSKIKENVFPPPIASGCNCEGSCTKPGECACAQLNGSMLLYFRERGRGRLVEARAVIFECGPACGCGPDCINRVSQQGLKFRLEVFRTTNRGWGVRSWDRIPSGSFICEYVGVVMTGDELEKVDDDAYLFDIDCVQTFKGLDGRQSRRGGISENARAYFESVSEKVPQFGLDAGPFGNVSRFINHSCQPNLFVQCITSHCDMKQPRIALFASETIPPMQELSYDYGYVINSVVGPDGIIKEKLCICGAGENCRKRLY